MSERWQKPVIADCKENVEAIIKEIKAADDLDLWQEADGKLTDVILIYRQAMQAKAEPTSFTFSDGVTRNIDAMAAAHAVAEDYSELDADDEFPAWMCRGEKGA